MRGFFDTPIEFLKGVGPQRAALLNKELNIFTFGDLIQHYPFRYEDRSRFYSIREMNEDMPFVQIKGKILKKELLGSGFKKRLVANFSDGAGEMELIWFQGINWVNEKIKPGIEYVVFGKPTRYGSHFSIAHPELEPPTANSERKGSLRPVYPLTEELRSRHIDSKTLSRFVQELLVLAKDKIRETLPLSLITENKFLSKKDALINIHFPADHQLLGRSQERLKFEELFYVQFRLLKMKLIRQEKF